MKKVEIDFKNCYGITSLQYSFGFDKGKIYVIYAPNGVMKTSFAKTFQDLSNAQETKDRIFIDKETKRIINDETNNF